MNQQLIQHFNQHGKLNTWYELAVMFNILPEGNRKQRADKVRKFYNRVYLKTTQEVKPVPTKKVDPLLEEFRSFLKSKNQNLRYTPYTSGNPCNILVIGDTHIPHQHPNYLEFLIELQKKWNCGKVIHIGDIVDFSSTTFHDVNPEMPSPAYEFEYAKAEIAKWYKVFPDLVITIGNHDRRVARKMNGNQIHGIWQRSFNDVFDTKWEFVPDYIYNNLYFCHGEGATARLTALQKQMSTVQGHRHSETYIDFPAKNLFAIQVPIGVNRESLAFEYAKVDPKEWTLGACIILNNTTPIIERL